jgi:lysozyme family protein
MADNFPVWWSFCQRPENDGHASDAAPGDPPTRWGFTYPTWCLAWRWVNAPNRADLSVTQFQSMTQDDMGGLARAYFWDRMHMPAMNKGADVSMMDFAWVSGGGIMEVQVLEGFTGADVDGVIGPKTLAAINGDPDFIDRCASARTAYYDAHGFQNEYPGLYRRTMQCRELALSL